MTFPIKIVTPDGLIFDGQAEKLIVRTTTGDRAILARHIDGVFPLGMGEAAVVYDGNRRTAACIGGLLSITDGEVTLVPTTFEWSDEIDADRADRSLHRAEAALKFVSTFVLVDIPVVKFHNTDYKTALQEKIQQKKNQTLSYHLVGEEGPDHDKRFRVEVCLNGVSIGTGSGTSKKRAEQDAARAALEGL